MAGLKKFAGHNDSGNPTDVAYQFTVKSVTSGGVQVGAMTAKSPETDAEAGFIKVNVNGTEYEIPFYAIV